MSPATASATRGCRSCGEEVREGRSYCGACSPSAPGNGHLIGDSAAVRSAKSIVKRHLAAGEIDLLRVLLDPPRTTRLDELLLCLPRMGEYALERAMVATGLYPRRIVSDMSEQERGRLVLYLREHGWLA